MNTRLMTAVATAALAYGSMAWAGPTYDFCVTRETGAKVEVLRARMNFGDIDPGKEAARVLVASRYKTGAVKSVSVSDFVEATCAGAARVDELHVTASAEQLQQLAGQVASGDVVNASVTAGEIAAGVTVETVKAGGNAVVRLIEGIGKALGF